MNTQKNIDVVKDAYINFQQGNIPALLNVLSDKVVWDSTGPEVVPFARKFEGKGEVPKFFGLVAESSELHRFEPKWYFGDGNKVVVLGEIEATSKPTGKKSTNSWVHVWTFEGGKVVHYRNYFDIPAVEESFKI